MTAHKYRGKCTCAQVHCLHVHACTCTLQLICTYTYTQCYMLQHTQFSQVQQSQLAFNFYNESEQEAQILREHVFVRLGTSFLQSFVK